MQHDGIHSQTASGELEYIQTRQAHLVRPPEIFPLESGERLPELTVAYETYGRLNPTADNAVLVCHGFTASAHAAGRHHAGSHVPGWWDAIIGPAKAFDTDRFFVVCANVLGSCKGTTGPSSVDPLTRRPYGPHFPLITIGDMIAAQRLLLDHLGVRRLVSVAGASMGGMQALEWGLRFPDTTLSALPIGCGARWSAQAQALSAAARRAIESDADFRGGDYYGHGRPVRGLAAARMIGHITYVSAEFLELQREVFEFQESADLLQYFQEECNRFVGRFDANSYIALSLAMERFDVSGHLLPSSDDTGGADWLLVSFSSDWLFPPSQLAGVDTALRQRGLRSRHVTVPTGIGHDAFLTESLKMATHIAEFLESVTQRRAPHLAVRSRIAADSAQHASRDAV